MTVLRLFSDPHLGVNRTAHTTVQSRAKLKQAVFDQVQAVLEAPEKLGFICLGDLFDTYHNDGSTLLQGYHVVSHCDIVLAGNHDASNRADSVSSLECLFKVIDAPALDADNDSFYSTALGGIQVYWVNHKLTQGLFEATLERLVTEPSSGPSILLLHCNYESPFATDAATLNLTRDTAERLLQAFDYIFIGHEHVYRQDFDRRLVMVGNTHPTSFADISDKFYWEVQITDSNIEQVYAVKIWEKDTGFLSVNWSDLSDLTTLGSEVQFLEVTGQAQAQHMPTIAKQVADLWKLSDALLMVKNSVTCAVGVVEEKPMAAYQDIP
jgi:DNA repair exonuclease SbcCD nuclease subunit